MLIHADPRAGKAAAIPGAAHIVIAVGEDGRLHMRSFCRGAWDSSYADGSDAVLQKVPGLLAELREQIGPLNSLAAAPCIANDRRAEGR